MPDIKIRELPSKFKEIKKESKKEESDEESEQESLEAIIQELRARAISKNQAMQHPSTRAATPVLKSTNIAQIVSSPQAPVTRSSNETEKDSRPVVYEGREKSKYEAASSNSDRKYDTQNSERKYSSDNSSKKSEDSRKVSPVLADTTSSSSQRGIFGTPQEQRDVQFGNNQGSNRDYEVNSLAENQDRRRSRRL